MKEPDCNINHQNWEDNDKDKTFNYLSEFFVSIVTYIIEEQSKIERVETIFKNVNM